MHFPNKPFFGATLKGPWGVDAHSGCWYVVHRTTLCAKRIGPVGAKRANYYTQAIAEAKRRNHKEKTT